MIEYAIRHRLIRPGMSFLDAGSGGTAEAEALCAVRLGWPITIVTAASTPPAKLAAIRAYGGAIVFSPAADGSEGARRLAAELARRHPGQYCFLNQYANPANPWAQRRTGQEILSQTGGNIGCVVVGVGTGGTSMGIAAALAGTGIRLIGVMPDREDHRIAGLRFVTPTNKPGILNRRVFHRVIHVSDAAAFEGAQYLAAEEGLYVGPSSGAVFAAWREFATRCSEPAVLLCHDSGTKYGER
jgi:cysteine synthase